MSVLGVGLDLFLVHHIPAAAESLFASLRDLAGPVLAAAICIPYVVVSKRVRGTFRY